MREPLNVSKATDAMHNRQASVPSYEAKPGSWLFPHTTSVVERAGGCHPRGHACGDPSRKGRSAAVCLFPYGAGRASNGDF